MLPRTHLTNLDASEEDDWSAPRRDVLPWRPNAERARVGSHTGNDQTSTPSWTSFTSEGSVTGTSGLEGDHDRIPAEFGKQFGEFEPALDPAAAGRRPVVADHENPLALAVLR